MPSSGSLGMRSTERTRSARSLASGGVESLMKPQLAQRPDRTGPCEMYASLGLGAESRPAAVGTLQRQSSRYVFRPRAGVRVRPVQTEQLLQPPSSPGLGVESVIHPGDLQASIAEARLWRWPAPGRSVRSPFASTGRSGRPASARLPLRPKCRRCVSDFRRDSRTHYPGSQWSCGGTTMRSGSVPTSFGQASGCAPKRPTTASFLDWCSCGGWPRRWPGLPGGLGHAGNPSDPATHPTQATHLTQQPI